MTRKLAEFPDPRKDGGLSECHSKALQPADDSAGYRDVQQCGILCDSDVCITAFYTAGKK